MKKTKLISNHAKVSVVLNAFQTQVSKRFNIKRTFSIKPDSKTYQNAIKFVDKCQEMDSSVPDVMKEAFDLYGSDWCLRTFKTPYPQLSVVLGDKCLKRIENQNIKPIKVTKDNLDSLVSQYFDVLKDMDYKIATDSIKGGWPSGPSIVRKKLLQKLKENKVVRT